MIFLAKEDQTVSLYSEIGPSINRNCTMGINCHAELAAADRDAVGNQRRTKRGEKER